MRVKARVRKEGKVTRVRVVCEGEVGGIGGLVE